MSNSYGSSGADPSIGGESSIGSGDGSSNADENITHTRGVIDDTLRNLTSIRDLITDENWESVAGRLDDVDATVEALRDELTDREV